MEIENSFGFLFHKHSRNSLTYPDPRLSHVFHELSSVWSDHWTVLIPIETSSWNLCRLRWNRIFAENMKECECEMGSREIHFLSLYTLISSRIHTAMFLIINHGRCGLSIGLLIRSKIVHTILGCFFKCSLVTGGTVTERKTATKEIWL